MCGEEESPWTPKEEAVKACGVESQAQSLLWKGHFSRELSRARVKHPVRRACRCQNISVCMRWSSP